MEPAEPAAFSWRALAGAFALPIVCLIPFLGKAYHIDDTFYLYVAEQILRDPLDFYGFTIHWGMLQDPAYVANKNPPGVSYMIAGIASLFGWHEVVHHAFAAVCGGLLGAGTYLVARRVCALPLLATVLAILTPAFLVSSNTVMSDVPMLAFYVWAIYLWMRGLERRSYGWLIASGVLIGGSALTKYFGITAVPLLAAYTVVRERRIDPRIALLAIPLLIVGGYQAYSYHLYGVNPLTDAASFALGPGWQIERIPGWAKPIVGLSFLGGCTASLIFVAPWLWGWRGIIAGVVLWAASFAVLLWLARVDRYPGRVTESSIALYSAQYALMIAGGVQVAVIAALDAWRRRDAASVLLLCWLGGTFVFSVFVNWTINVRTMLPLVPASAILATRRLELRYPADEWRWPRRLAAPLAVAAALCFCVLWADYRHAESAKTAAAKFVADKAESGHRYFFKGHWGFQYYAERAGIPAFNPQGTQYGPGDRIIVPVNNVVFGRLNPAIARAYKRLSLELPASRWISTNNRKTGAGFYWHYYGSAPYVFGPVPDEEYAVYELGDYEGRAARGESVPIEIYEVPEGIEWPPE